MVNPIIDPSLKYPPDPYQESFSKTILGFWIYLMTDCMIFATLFSAYAVLHTSTFGGPSGKELFSLPLVFSETMVLLASSFICGMGILAARLQKKGLALLFLSLAFLCGLSFVIMEVSEFTHFVQDGHTWETSAFLSSYFTLVGTHGLHVSIGLLWLVVVMCQIMWYGFTVDTFRRLVCFSMFWHFLDLVWIFIFTFVYLMGVI